MSGSSTRVIVASLIRATRTNGNGRPGVCLLADHMKPSRPPASQPPVIRPSQRPIQLELPGPTGPYGDAPFQAVTCTTFEVTAGEFSGQAKTLSLFARPPSWAPKYMVLLAPWTQRSEKFVVVMKWSTDSGAVDANALSGMRNMTKRVNRSSEPR